MSANGLALGEEAYFEELNCLPALNLIRSTKLHLSTEPAFLPNACYAVGFLSLGIVVIFNGFIAEQTEWDLIRSQIL